MTGVAGEPVTLMQIIDTPDRMSILLARLADAFTDVSVICEWTADGLLHLDVEVSF